MAFLFSTAQESEFLPNCTLPHARVHRPKNYSTRLLSWTAHGITTSADMRPPHSIPDGLGHPVTHDRRPHLTMPVLPLMYNWFIWPRIVSHMRAGIWMTADSFPFRRNLRTMTASMAWQGYLRQESLAWMPRRLQQRPHSATTIVTDAMATDENSGHFATCNSPFGLAYTVPRVHDGHVERRVL